MGELMGKGRGSGRWVSGIGIGVVLTLTAGGGEAWEQVFECRVDQFYNGWEPTCLRVADLNEDGATDIVSCVNYPPEIVVHLRDHQNDFVEHFRVGVGDFPYRLHVDDFDDDGHIDLVVSDTGLDCLHVLMGRGDGTFTYPTRYPTANNPWEIKSGDLNEDGARDIVVSVSGAGTVMVLFGDGRGHFPAVASYQVGLSPWPIQVVDFDLDGHEDVAVGALHSEYVTVMLGDGTGSFPGTSTYPITGEPRAMSVGRFDGDPYPDLAVSSGIPGVGARLGDDDPAEGDVVTILRGLGDGTFEPFGEYSGLNLPFHMITSDFSGDGTPDLGVINWHESNLAILIGRGDGTFGEPIHHGTAYHPTWIEEIDLNTDGRMDYVVNGFCAGEFAFHLGRNATVADDTSYPVGERPSAICASDFDGDGREDLAVANRWSHDVSVLRGEVGGRFTLWEEFDTGDYPHSIAVTNLNDDGHPDLVVVSFGSRDVRLYAGNGDGAFQEVNQIYLGLRPEDVAPADLNGDSLTDLVVGNSYGGRIHVLLGEGGGAFSPPAYYPAGQSVRSVCAADLDGDGRDDVISASEGDGRVTAFLNDGAGLLAESDRLFVVDGDMGPVNSTGAVGVACGDFDGDPYPDLAVVSNRGDYFNGRLTLFRGNGDGTFQEGSGYESHEIVRSVVVADLNNDQRDDVVVSASATHNSVSDGFTVFLGNGDGTVRNGHKFATGARKPQLKKPYDAVVGDWNDDGYLDLASASSWTGEATVHLNWGSGEAPMTDLPGGGDPPALPVWLTPNPTPMAGRVSISAPGGGPSTLRVYDVAGRLVRHFDRTSPDPQWWDLRDGAGRPLSAGVYYVRLEGPGSGHAKLVVIP